MAGNNLASPLRGKGDKQEQQNITLDQLSQMLKLVKCSSCAGTNKSSQQHKISLEFAIILIKNQLSGINENIATKLANHLNLLLIPIHQAIAWFINNFIANICAETGKINIGKDEYDKYIIEYVETYALDLQMNQKFDNNNLAANNNEDYKIMLTTWKMNEKLLESMGKEFGGSGNGNALQLLGILSFLSEKVSIEIIKKFGILGFIDQNLNLLEQFSLIELNQNNNSSTAADLNSTVIITMKKGIRNYIWFCMDLKRTVQIAAYFIGQHLPLCNLPTTEYRLQIFCIISACVENDPTFMIKSGCLLNFFKDAILYYDNCGKNIQQFDEIQSLLESARFVWKKLSVVVGHGLPLDDLDERGILQHIVEHLENI